MTHDHEKQSDDKLAALLKDFGDTVARKSQLSGSQREQLIDSIVCAVESQPVADIPKTRWFETRHWVAAVIASSVVLILAFVYWGQSPHQGFFPAPIPLPILVQGFAEMHHDQIRIALEHEAIMGHPLAWYAEQGNDVQFALLPVDMADRSSRVVFAELTIERLHGEPETCFIMIRDSQPLELYSKGGSTLKLLLWLYPVEDNLFAYELAFNGLDQATNLSGLIEPETTIGDGKDNGEYRVFLRVHPT